MANFVHREFACEGLSFVTCFVLNVDADLSATFIGIILADSTHQHNFGEYILLHAVVVVNASLDRRISHAILTDEGTVSYTILLPASS